MKFDNRAVEEVLHGRIKCYQHELKAAHEKLAAAQEALRSCQSFLQYLNRKGGLGLSVHDELSIKLHEIADALVPSHAVLTPRNGGSD